MGLSPSVNAAIDTALKEGAISSSTIIANSLYLNEVRNIVSKYPKASFGIHLNLTEGLSITNNPMLKKYGIIDAEGNFIKGNYQKCFYPNEKLKQAISEEWNAQITLLKKEGFALSHADGHHHCHTWPGLEEVLMTLLNEHGIERTRNRYRYPNLTLKSKLHYSLFGICCRLHIKFGKRHTGVIETIELYNSYREALTKYHIRSTTYFGHYLKYLEILKKNPAWHPNVLVELMCHPGNPVYIEEMKTLIQEKDFIRNNYSLVSYKSV